MTGTRTIDIDFEIHKAIEAERRGFDESANDVLRRLLGLSKKASGSIQLVQNGRAWSGYNVVLPQGTRLQMTYNGTRHSGEIVDGYWVVDGQSFSSPSGAASGVARTKKGGKTRLDGWNYWEVQFPGSAAWESIFTVWERANPDKANGPS